jgi:hypothetical protein
VNEAQVKEGKNGEAIGLDSFPLSPICADHAMQTSSSEMAKKGSRFSQKPSPVMGTEILEAILPVFSLPAGTRG